MVVAMHVPSATATKSVGENASPRPWLSLGASVTSSVPEGPWVAVQCRSPWYSPVILTMRPTFAETTLWATVKREKPATKDRSNFPAAEKLNDH